MAAETCAVCGDTVPFAAAAHVLLNPPDDPVRDGYLCPSCYEDHFEGVLEHVEVAETGDDEGDESDEDADGGDADDEPIQSPDGQTEESGDDPADPAAEAGTNDADS